MEPKKNITRFLTYCA